MQKLMAQKLHGVSFLVLCSSPILAQTGAAVLTESCNFADKRCNLLTFPATAPNRGRIERGPSRRGLKMLQFEGYTLDFARGSLRAADRDVQLRPKAFEV